MKRTNQIGAGYLVAVLLVLVVAIVGFAGYKVYNTQNMKDQNSTGSMASEKKVTTQAPELKAADQTLTQTGNDLNTGLDTSALDSDINAML